MTAGLNEGEARGAGGASNASGAAGRVRLPPMLMPPMLASATANGGSSSSLSRPLSPPLASGSAYAAPATAAFLGLRPLMISLIFAPFRRVRKRYPPPKRSMIITTAAAIPPPMPALASEVMAIAGIGGEAICRRSIWSSGVERTLTAAAARKALAVAGSARSSAIAV